MSMQHTIQTQAKLIAEFRATLIEYLEWGAMTGSDRYIFEQKFKKLVNDTAAYAPAAVAEAKGGKA